MHGFRRAAQANQSVKVVNVQVHQRAARLFRVKCGQNLPPLKGIIAGGVLAVVHTDHAQTSNVRQTLLQLLIGRQVVDVHCLCQAHLPLGGQGGQLLQFPYIRRDGLFYNDIFMVLHSLLPIGKVQRVGKRHVDRIRIGSQHLVIIKKAAVQLIDFAKLFRRPAVGLPAQDIHGLQ